MPEALRQTTPAGGEARLHVVLYRGVFLVALATLLFEISLIRVLSFTIWYHFAYVVISTALLGFGASGTLLALRPDIGAGDLRAALARLSGLAAASALLALVFFAVVPLEPMRIFDEPRDFLLLLAYQLVAAVPFFFSGLVISLALRAAARKVDRLYFWDLVGGGLGCALAVVLMDRVAPPGAVVVAGAAFALAGAVFAASRSARVAGAALAAGMALLAPLAQQLPFPLAPSKHMAIQLAVLGGEPVFTRWTALFRTDVLRIGDDAPLPEEWGLSLESRGPIRRPYGYVHHDGSAGTAVWDLRDGPIYQLDRLIHGLPYEIAPARPRVLVIGVGGGIDVLTALHFGASHVTGVELDPETVGLIRDELADVNRSAFRRPEVELVAGEGRHYVKRSDQRFDLIQITGVDTLAAQSSGAYVLAENYIYTVEAFGEYLDHLTPDGMLSITTACVDMQHPRTAGRMVSVAHRALRERGIESPQDHIAVIFSTNLYATVLVRTRPFSPEEIRRLEQVSADKGFVPLYLPGGASKGVFRALVSLDGEAREAVLDQRRYLIYPVTDDSPFFFRFFRWHELFDVSEIDPLHASALGQLVLLALLISLSVFGALFVLMPLGAFRSRGIPGAGGPRLGLLVYFAAVGLGFMLFEISLLQRFVLYLGYPTYSLSVVLFSLLVFLGFGSFLSRRWVGRERAALPLAVLALGGLALFYMQGLPRIQDHTLGMALALRVAISLAALAPLGLVLGMFFPLGVRAAERIHPDLVPWGWAINGCASVTATVLAVILAMSWGFSRVWVLSVVIYALGVLALLATGAASPDAGTRRAADAPR